MTGNAVDEVSVLLISKTLYVAIPARIRDRLGVRKGDKFTFDAKGEDEIVYKKKERS